MNMQPELQPVRSNPNTYGTFGAAISAESQKVLRNTYLLLALTMVPTLAGAFIGMSTASVVMAHPIMTTFAMIALLVAMIANMFLQIPALALTISTLVIVVFSLFLLHDLSRIVTGGETNYLMATTGVYLSLFNIFANLLQILLALGGERD